MLVADGRKIDQEYWVEIQPRWDTTPAFSADLERFGIRSVRRSRVLRIDGVETPISPAQFTALYDPILERIGRVGRDDGSGSACLDVFSRPGVTDTEGEMASMALRLAGASEMRCRAALRYRFERPVAAAERDAVERLLGNPLIHLFLWHGEHAGEPRTDAVVSRTLPVEAIALSDAEDVDLLFVSRSLSLALDVEEMRTVAEYFAGLGRAPTDVELQSIALAWSEHCSHKTFKANILFDCDGSVEIIRGMLRECIMAPTAALGRPWVRSAFDDNAGVIAFDRQHDLAFKVETHNHPSALEPFGGAHTGLGGVIRDVLAVSAEPIANTDVLCFGPLDLPAEEVPAGAFHPARSHREVVRGIADYGNNMGIPTVGGAVLFHPGYSGNPLVYAGTLGIAPRNSHPRAPRAGDHIVLLGGRTGRDGLHGATMSSETLDRSTVESSTVQIGAPITEKILRDVIPLLRDRRLYHAITDCGAGGLCSAVGEMGETLGIDVELAAVPLKYEGLSPWEVWLSEAQERMVLAVGDEALDHVLKICGDFDLEATSIGRFRDDGIMHLTCGGKTVGKLDMRFVHGGQPERTLQATWRTPVEHPYCAGQWSDPAEILRRLLAHPNIASKEKVIRRYDHEVGAATIVKPLVGRAGPSDAAVLQPLTHSERGAVLAHGINPFYGEADPHAMAMLAVDEALRNLVAVGGSIDRAALLDNFCWGDVDDENHLGSLLRAAQGCRDAALAYGVPFICGKDSLRNTSVDAEGRHSIPGTLLISAVGVIPSVRRTVTMDLKRSGSRLYLLGRTYDEMAGSHYLLLCGGDGGTVPRVRPEETRNLMRTLTGAIWRGLVLSSHDLSEGGLAVAAAEMSLAGGLGITVDLERVPADIMATETLLFAESSGRFLVEVDEVAVDRFERLMSDVAMACIGQTDTSERFVVRRGAEAVIDVPVSEVERIWKGEGPTGGVEDRAAPTPPDIRLLPARSNSSKGYAPRYSGRPRALVLAAAGVNCDRETAEACRLAGAEVEVVHLNRLLRGEVSLQDFGLLVLPGGFSYGDHLGAGAMLATVVRHRLLADLEAFVASGRPLLGICNGFQVLCRLGLLGNVSLATNLTGRFECRWTPLRVEPSACVFLRDIETLELPIAHGEGRVVTAPDALDEVLTHAPLRYLDNPNGSMADIAGVCNAAGNVLGLMPHPERYVIPHQHPARRDGTPDGLLLFRNALSYLREL